MATARVPPGTGRRDHFARGLTIEANTPNPHNPAIAEPHCEVKNVVKTQTTGKDTRCRSHWWQLKASFHLKWHAHAKVPLVTGVTHPSFARSSDLVNMPTTVVEIGLPVRDKGQEDARPSSTRSPDGTGESE